MPQTLKKQTLESTYEDLHPLVYRVTQQFCRQYSMPFDDLVSVAHEVYVKEYHRYFLEKKYKKYGTRLSSWLYTKMWFGLMSYVRRETIHRQRYANNCEELLDYRGAESPNMFRIELNDELSERANAVVRLLLDANEDLSLALSFKWSAAQQPYVRRNDLLRLLREHLEDLGWKRQTISRAFREIRNVLAAQ